MSAPKGFLMYNNKIAKAAGLSLFYYASLCGKLRCIDKFRLKNIR